MTMSRRFAPLVAALLASFVLAACGSSSTTSRVTPGESAPRGGNSSTAAAGAGRPGQSQSGAPREGGGGHYDAGGAHFTPPAHHDSGGGAAQFEEKGGDNSLERFGSEASPSDFAHAAAALHGYLDARAARAWASACSFMEASIRQSLTRFVGEAKKGNPACPNILGDLFAGLPDAVLREATVADVGALRREGQRGFLLFKGAHGGSYFMPMARDGGEWKVAALAPSAL